MFIFLFRIQNLSVSEYMLHSFILREIITSGNFNLGGGGILFLHDSYMKYHYSEVNGLF
jgi:hypothetical protein